jgi:hypothetical protein
VISADSGPNAISLSEKTAGKIDLLQTDWAIPEMSGIAPGQELKMSDPIFMPCRCRAERTTACFVGAKLIEMVTEVFSPQAIDPDTHPAHGNEPKDSGE